MREKLLGRGSNPRPEVSRLAWIPTSISRCVEHARCQPTFDLHAILYICASNCQFCARDCQRQSSSELCRSPRETCTASSREETTCFSSPAGSARPTTKSEMCPVHTLVPAEAFGAKGYVVFVAEGCIQCSDGGGHGRCLQCIGGRES